jgi:hypothetical protein
MVSVRRVAPVILLLVALPLAGAPSKKTSSHPPRDLHRVGDHWTPYNPPDPSTYAPAAKTYTVKRGDTLWALAKQFYGNPYLWPQLWETNAWITDAHWIYPGDTLLIQGEAASQASVPTTPTVTPTPTEQPAPTPTVAMTPTSSPVPIATEADLYCYGYIGDPKEPMPNVIDSFEDTEMMYQADVAEQEMSVSTGDLVFVKGGTSSGIVAGDTYLLVEPGETVVHPRTQRVMGQHYDFVGQLKILCADETRSRAVITQSCREVHLGARLKPLPQLPIPIARVPDLPGICDASTGRSMGTIVDSKGWEFALGIGDLVQVDLGRDDQMQPGDFLTVFRDSLVSGQPRQVLGELGILTTESHTATARVLSMRRAMQIGDRVEMR